MSQMAKQGEKALHLYYLEGGTLREYVYDAKQQFETTVVPQVSVVSYSNLVMMT